jgi:hypothetical protein
MNCKICGKSIILTPSAIERAKKYGKTPQYYTALFPVHSECMIKTRENDTRKLMHSKKVETVRISKF